MESLEGAAGEIESQVREEHDEDCEIQKEDTVEYTCTCGRDEEFNEAIERAESAITELSI